MNLFTTRPHDTASDANAQHFLMSQFLLGKAFITLAVVMSVNEDGSTVSVRPMVEGFTGSGDIIPNSVIHGVPVWRLQRGGSAVKMKPVAMDIGMIAICDRDITSVKKSKSPSLPGSNRNHSYSDAIYLGGVLNAEPTQFIDFKDNGIDVISPMDININGSSININGISKISLNSPVIEANGQLTQGAGDQGGNATFGGTISAVGDVTGAGVSLSAHTHGGVESGDSRTQGPQ